MAGVGGVAPSPGSFRSAAPLPRPAPASSKLHRSSMAAGAERHGRRGELYGRRAERHGRWGGAPWTQGRSSMAEGRGAMAAGQGGMTAGRSSMATKAKFTDETSKHDSVFVPRSRHYKRGVLSGACGTQLNHVVAVVGYDVDAQAVSIGSSRTRGGRRGVRRATCAWRGASGTRQARAASPCCHTSW
ncbi:hypothetical protein ACP70R_007770 [Stipagrostis hirtigluma subsp. patula]